MTNSPDKMDFQPLSGTEYVNYRVIPQRDWYVGEIDADYQQLRRNRTLILIIGALWGRSSRLSGTVGSSTSS